MYITQFFYCFIRKNFQSDEEWHLFYCNSIPGCQVIQDFDLCKLEGLRQHNANIIIVIMVMLPP